MTYLIHDSVRVQNGLLSEPEWDQTITGQNRELLFLVR